MRSRAYAMSGALLYPHLVGPDLGRSKPVNNGAFSDETHITVVKVLLYWPILILNHIRPSGEN